MSMKGHALHVPLKNITVRNTAASIYFLFEHKAQPDKEIGFQLECAYMVRIWEEQKRNQIERRPIIPLVIYHGEKRWTSEESFQESYEVAEPFRPYVPQFRYTIPRFLLS